MKKKILSLLLALVMALSLVPTSVLAAPVDLGKAHVIVENTTFTKPVDGKAPAWTGTLVDTWVKLTEDSTMMGCVFEALDAKGYTHTGTTYIGEINGLSEFDGGGQSGWMGTLNDWFANRASPPLPWLPASWKPATRSASCTAAPTAMTWAAAGATMTPPSRP